MACPGHNKNMVCFTFTWKIHGDFWRNWKPIRFWYQMRCEFRAPCTDSVSFVRSIGLFTLAVCNLDTMRICKVPRLCAKKKQQKKIRRETNTTSSWLFNYYRCYEPIAIEWSMVLVSQCLTQLIIFFFLFLVCRATEFENDWASRIQVTEGREHYFSTYLIIIRIRIRR